MAARARGSHERKELLIKEKEWNRQRDALSAERRKLPMVRIERDYVFEGPREMPSLSVFLRDGDRLFHTYATHIRGLDQFLNTYNFLDHTPLGRQEGAARGMARRGGGVILTLSASPARLAIAGTGGFAVACAALRPSLALSRPSSVLKVCALSACGRIA